MRAINPYESVDWNDVGHRIAELHVHTNYSGGLENPADIVDAYHDLGYEILSISSRPNWRRDDGEFLHAWPWTELDGVNPDSETVNAYDGPWEGDRDPAELGMVAIRGLEDANHDPSHFFWYFTDYNPEDYDFPNRQFDRVRKGLETSVDALATTAHPGRYVDSDTRGEWASGEWESKRYDLFYRSVQDIEMEVFNGGVGNHDDRILWDDLLTKFAPFRNVIGFGVDDASDIDKEADNRVDSGRSVFLMDDDEFVPGHETGDIREVMASGQSYFSAVDDNSNEHPTIESVEHDKEAGTLTVEPSPVDHEKWIADGEVIETGQTLDYGANSGHINGYVRFEGVVGGDALPGDENHPPEAVVCTQPFLTTGTIAQGEQA